MKKDFILFPEAGIKIINAFPALYIEKISAVVVADLHLGYEGFKAEKEGLAIPKVQYKEIVSLFKKILKRFEKPKYLIIAGDIRPGFGELTIHEYLEVRDFLDFAKERFEEVIVCRGNHDNYVVGVATRKGVEFPSEKCIDRFLFCHGDNLPETSESEFDYLIMGHEHPALTLRSEIGIKEKIKCFLYGETRFLKQKKKFIVLPALSIFSEGVAVNEVEAFLSPILKKISVDDLMAAGLIEGQQVLAFPKIGKLKALAKF